MTIGMFLSLIREYAALARRFNRSFSEAVDAILDDVEKVIDASGLSDEDKAAQKAHFAEIADREYGQWDSNFVSRNKV